MENGDKDCLTQCKDIQGKCPDYCGFDGYCCKKDSTGNGCDGSIGGSDRLECVLKGMQNLKSKSFNCYRVSQSELT